ncbi:CLUMA_CG006202, isoform A [Clunio marinus]|uniref:CLUMA_CG006202, isoform A n=1 Tax=Clunio marinus TaxID=568069 RepID=A0A1J1HYM9_9DIPT|nr:CLUMA_CG006202, isoform A [Clunio marinus]
MNQQTAITMKSSLCQQITLDALTKQWNHKKLHFTKKKHDLWNDDRIQNHILVTKNISVEFTSAVCEIPKKHFLFCKDDKGIEVNQEDDVLMDEEEEQDDVLFDQEEQEDVLFGHEEQEDVLFDQEEEDDDSVLANNFNDYGLCSHFKHSSSRHSNSDSSNNMLFHLPSGNFVFHFSPRGISCSIFLAGKLKLISLPSLNFFHGAAMEMDKDLGCLHLK